MVTPDESNSQSEDIIVDAPVISTKTNTQNDVDTNIDADYEAFMNSDNDLLGGENDANLINIDVNENEIHTLILAQGDEWIIDLRSDQNISYNMFGIELANNIEYLFNSQDKMVLFAVEACEIFYRTNKTLLKQFPECIMKNDPNILAIYSIALKLAQKRLGNLRGPRVLIIGDSKSGKSSLAKTLLVICFEDDNFFKLTNICKFGSNATVVDDNLQVENPMWGESIISSTHPLVPVFQPLVKQFGFEEIDRYNYDFYLRQVDSLAEDVVELINDRYSILQNKRGGEKGEKEEKEEEEEEDVIIPNTEPENININDEMDHEMAVEKEEKIATETVEPELEVPVLEVNKDTTSEKETKDTKTSDYESEYEDDEEEEEKEEEQLKMPELPTSSTNLNQDAMEVDEVEDSNYTPAIKQEFIDLPYDVSFIGRLVDKFEIDHIIDVVDADGEEDVTKYLHDRLFSLSTRVNKAFIFPIVKPSSINKDTITDSFKRFVQRLSIRAYFYGGTPKFPLSPYTTTVRYEDVHIFKHLENDCGSLVKIDHITKDLLQYSVLAVTNADIKTKDSNAIIESGIMGYVLVLSVLDASNKQLLKILSPTMGDLPKRAMLLTDFKYYE
ncbi:hypothetical protein ACO0SA_000019 [Hanseniaspora valbyensis]